MRASDLAEHLGITHVSAANLAVELAEAGLLAEIRHRRYARIWATPEVARLLEPRAVARRARQIQTLNSAAGRPAEPAPGPAQLFEAGRDPNSVAREWSERKARSEGRLEKIYGDLDEALARTEAILGRRPGA